MSELDVTAPKRPAEVNAAMRPSAAIASKLPVASSVACRVPNAPTALSP